MNQQTQQSTKIILKSTYITSPNIAWIKYWGKYDEANILPLNDNLGFTLNSQDINTITTITFSSGIQQDSLMLNSQKHPLSKRIVGILKKVKNIVKQRKEQFKKIDQKVWESYGFIIESVNSFPTASGLASSASGLACLVAALNGLFDNIFTQEQLSQLARRGSGSASRSIHGGLVQWNGIPSQYLKQPKPSQQTLQLLNKHCLSKTVVQPQNLSFIDVFILLAHQNQKQTSSTSGMQQSMETSQLIQLRNQIASERVKFILGKLESYRKLEVKEEQYKCFSEIAQTIIKDSNQFHAICLDTYPPIIYLEQFSKQIMFIVDHILNPVLKCKIAYTFDAGPHAFLFLHKDVSGVVLSYLYQLFGLKSESLNESARKKLEIHNDNQNQKKQKIYQFKKYQKDVIKPVALWATSVGKGAEKYTP